MACLIRSGNRSQKVPLYSQKFRAVAEVPFGFDRLDGFLDPLQPFVDFAERQYPFYQRDFQHGGENLIGGGMQPLNASAEAVDACAGVSPADSYFRLEASRY